MRAQRSARIVRQVNPALLPRPESYRLLIETQGITLIGADDAGLFYGGCTLSQIARTAGEHREDEAHAAGLPHRGLARLRAPRRDARRQPRQGADDGHPVRADRPARVRGSSTSCSSTPSTPSPTAATRSCGATRRPFTAEEILRARRITARERFIELVPNQNSFGHLQRWLLHERYRQLAEVPEAASSTPWRPPRAVQPLPHRSRRASRCSPISTTSSCRTSAAAVQRRARRDLRPRHGALEAGCGRSAARCASTSTSCSRCTRWSRARGHRMQFWGDIIMSSRSSSPSCRRTPSRSSGATRPTIRSPTTRSGSPPPASASRLPGHQQLEQRRRPRRQRARQPGARGA